MKTKALILLFIATVLCLAQTKSGKAQPRTINGVITDDMCATGDHSRMRMGPTDPECTIQCVRLHGSQYVLYDGKEVYNLSDQETPEKFAGQKVTVTGVLTGTSLQVQSIRAQAK